MKNNISVQILNESKNLLEDMDSKKIEKITHRLYTDIKRYFKKSSYKTVEHSLSKKYTGIDSFSVDNLLLVFNFDKGTIDIGNRVSDYSPGAGQDIYSIKDSPIKSFKIDENSDIEEIYRDIIDTVESGLSYNYQISDKDISYLNKLARALSSTNKEASKKLIEVINLL